MKNHERIFKYIGIAAIMLLLFGLLGWYYFLQKEARSIESADSARGFSIGIPSFVGSRGSSVSNAGGESVASSESPRASGGSGEKGSAFLRFLGIGLQESAAKLSDIVSPENTAPESTGKKAPRLWRVSNTPIAGAAFTGASTRLRYVERATGQVFDADPKEVDTKRLTNTLIPKIYEAFIGGGNLIVERGVEDGRVVTMTGRIGTTTEDGYAKLESKNLGIPIVGLATLPSSSDLLMLTPAAEGFKIIRSLSNGTKPKELFSIPAGDFHLLWISDTYIVLVEKAASGIAGHAYAVTKTLDPLVRNVPGLLILPHPKKSALLYSSDDGRTLRLFASLPNASAAMLPIATVAEKCAWSLKETNVAYCAVPQGDVGELFLDRWYRGELHTEDVWYRVNASSGEVTRFFSSESQSIDVQNPIIDESGTYLAFTNARDKSLWVLRIPE